ncbi:hypothetical protein D3C71_1838410 [compost metagenome]
MHVLRRTAVASKARDETPMPLDATYDTVAGVWRGRGGPLASDPAFERGTKKNDIETGEDQKGQ